MPTGWDDHNPNDPPGGGGVSDMPGARPQDFSGYDPQDGGSATKRLERDWYDQPAWQRNRPGNPAEAVRFGQRYVETADPANNMEQPSQWQGRTVGQEGQYPRRQPMDTRTVGMPEQEQQPAPEKHRWKNRTVTREKSQPVEPRQQALPHYPQADFTGNRHGNVSADAEAVQQDSQQR
ncbi:hypothetical protein, partial [Endozoicomonas acroporae]|uniref:hypothetical protein n=1 Tax=Endozoicomonas acroporae TaxID=1701104 RepID=UPI003D78F9EF